MNYVPNTVKFLLLLILVGNALALPGPEEAARILGSAKASEREELTAELWKSGRTALLLLGELAKSDDPEVSQRATFIFHRLRMGLQPDSPADLLKLAEEVEIANPKERITRLEKLLEHALGVPVALAFLDIWANEHPLNTAFYRSWAEVVTSALIEQRNYWREFLTQPLTTQCRSAIIAALDDESMPMKHVMIERLASGDTREIFKILKAEGEQLNSGSYENLARSALVDKEARTALEILFTALASATDDGIARRISFLEKALGLPATPYKGPWDTELEMFRLRISKAHEKLSRLNSQAAPDSLFTYENHLLRGDCAIPSGKLPIDDLARSLATSIGQFLANPPRKPDIEDLASTITNDAGRLARGLLILGHPLEAAQILSDRHQNDLAVRILWMTGHREQARKLANNVMINNDLKARISVRLVLIQLLGLSGLQEEARTLFTPLFEQKIEFDHLRRNAATLALLLYPREKALELLPEINEKSPYRRQMAIATMLPFRAKVSVLCYEEILESHPELPPSQILTMVEKHLAQDRVKLLEHYRTKLETIDKRLTNPTNPIFHLALFLKAPGALEMLKRFSWNRLSFDELENLVADESWDLASRRSALKTALEIAPGSASIRNFDRALNQQGDHDFISLLTLGEPSEVLQLARWNPETPALSWAAELADLKQPASIRCLILACNTASPADTIRFFQSALHGELILGTHPGTPLGKLMTSLETYFESRVSEADSARIRLIWEERRTSAITR